MLWRIDEPKEAARQDKLNAEQAVETAKRIQREAKNPERAKAKALKEAQAYEMEDDMDSAKDDAKESGERWSEKKGEWIEQWLAVDWDAEKQAKFEAGFYETWEAEHGAPFPEHGST